MPRWMRYTIAGLAVLLLLAGGAFYGLWTATTYVPADYRLALDVKPEALAEAGKKFEQQVNSLYDEAQDLGVWEATFTDDQVNGWLANELPARMPQIIPRGVSDPRVLLREDEATLLCRYEKIFNQQSIQTVVSLAVDVELTDETNVIAVRLRHARAGLFSLPMEEVKQRITQLAANSRLALRWEEDDGDPVAIIVIPQQYEQLKARLTIDTIELRDGELHVAGRSEPLRRGVKMDFSVLRRVTQGFSTVHISHQP